MKTLRVIPVLIIMLLAAVHSFAAGEDKKRPASRSNSPLYYCYMVTSSQNIYGEEEIIISNVFAVYQDDYSADQSHFTTEFVKTVNGIESKNIFTNLNYECVKGHKSSKRAVERLRQQEIQKANKATEITIAYNLGYDLDNNFLAKP